MHRSPSGCAGAGRRGLAGWRGAAAALAACCAAASPAMAQTAGPAAIEPGGAGVTERYGAQVPLELPMADSDGGETSLGEVFDGTRPAILTINCFDCPMLCSLQLDGLVAAMKKMAWSTGQEYHVVTVAIDPEETSERAAMVKQKHLESYGRAGAASGWSFLTCRKEEDIRKLAEAVGISYARLPDAKGYAHPAVLVICTPDGRVSRYIGGVDYDPQTLRFALAEAAEGKIGSVGEPTLLLCRHEE
jgi:protein SCO1